MFGSIIKAYPCENSSCRDTIDIEVFLCLFLRGEYYLQTEIPQIAHMGTV